MVIVSEIKTPIYASVISFLVNIQLWPTVLLNADLKLWDLKCDQKRCVHHTFVAFP